MFTLVWAVVLIKVVLSRKNILLSIIILEILNLMVLFYYMLCAGGPSIFIALLVVIVCDSMLVLTGFTLSLTESGVSLLAGVSEL